MPELRPFRGIRYADTDHIADLVCPPYDVISLAEQDRLHERHPHNAVRFELARPSPGGADKYADLKDLFDEWVRERVLARDEASLYVYRQDFTSDGERRRVAGVIGALRLEPFGETGGVLPHERTMPGPKQDRLSLMRSLPLNVSPIFAVYRGRGAIGPFLDSLENRPPVVRFQDDQGILHRLWQISAPAEVELLASGVAAGPLVIADGHHRYETALAFHRESQEQGRTGGHDAMLCFCVDADSEGLVVLPYNRALRSNASPQDLEGRLQTTFATTVVAPDKAAAAVAGSDADHAFVFLFPGTARLIELDSARVASRLPEAHDAWRGLDVVVLHEVVLPEILDGGDPELTFSRDPEQVMDLVREQGWTAGVLMRPISPAQIVDVARSGERMPQKASYFWPKAMTGLVFRELS